MFTLANQEGGYNSSIREILISMPKLDDGIAPAIILDSENTVEIVKPIIEKLLDAPPARSGGSIQSGGELDTNLIETRTLLFKEICSIAARYVKGTLHPRIPEMIKLNVLNNLKYSIKKNKEDIIPIQLNQAREYDPEITIDNLDEHIMKVKHVLNDIGQIPTIFNSEEEKNKVLTTIEEIKFIWETKYLETIGDEGLHDTIIWDLLLEPFNEDNTLKDTHIYVMNKKDNALMEDAIRKKFINYPEIVSLIILAIINDILEGSVSRNTSVFTGLFLKDKTKELPAWVSHVKIDTHKQWERLVLLIQNLYIGITRGKISLEVVRLITIIRM